MPLPGTQILPKARRKEIRGSSLARHGGWRWCWLVPQDGEDFLHFHRRIHPHGLSLEPCIVSQTLGVSWKWNLKANIPTCPRLLGGILSLSTSTCAERGVNYLLWWNATMGGDFGLENDQAVLRLSPLFSSLFSLFLSMLLSLRFLLP